MIESALLPHDSFVGVLRTFGEGPFDWTSQPYYQEAPEPQPKFPYCVYDCTFASRKETFEDDYTDVWDATLKVVGLNATAPEGQDIVTLGSPYGDPTVSVNAFLDKFVKNPSVFNSDAFLCNDFYVESIALTQEPTRAPDTTRAWTFEVKYKIEIQAAHNRM